MAPFKVGCVPYVNAIPLVHVFESLGDRSPVHVVYDVPSNLPARLESGECQAVLVSIYDPLTVPGRVLVPNVCIGSDGPVKSVRLFSKTPFEQIESLALDASSMTSNALARIVLKRRYGVEPQASVEPPDLEAMLEKHDACVLIGDRGMAEGRQNLRVADLGHEWSELFALPFVWAAWVGRDGLSPELSGLLQDAYLQPERFGCASDLETWIDAARSKTGFMAPELRSYFEDAMRYEMDERGVRGLLEFSALLRAEGVETFEPRFVGAEPVAV